MNLGIARLSGLPAVLLVLGLAFVAWCLVMAAQKRRWWWALAIIVFPVVGSLVFLIMNPDPSQQTGPKHFDG